MTTSLPTLRMNQGDASEARIYYCAHFVAEELGLFRSSGVSVTFTTTKSGGKTIQGGQIPAVLSGEADLTIGGPMVTMKNHEDGGTPLVSFCAAVERNPWFLAGRTEKDGFKISDLRGARVIDVGNVGTASLCFRWLLDANGLTGDAVEILPGSGSQEADLDRVASGEIDYALHSLHALAPAIATGRLAIVSDLAEATGPVPWSAYIARPEVIAGNRIAFAAFAAAIAGALNWIRTNTAASVAELVAPYYPDYPIGALQLAVQGYQQAQVFAASTAIAQADFDHFAAILRGAGWLTSDVPYDALVDTSLIAKSIANSSQDA